MALLKTVLVLLTPTGTIEIPVVRHGSDLSSVASVWCATRPADHDSATPGVDYIPSSKKVEFKPGVKQEVQSVDISMCVLSGNQHEPVLH